MVRYLLIAVPMLVACLMLQTVFVTACLRHYVGFRVGRRTQESRWLDMMLLASVMILMLLGNIAQIVLWALLFMYLGEFDDFVTASYHSGVNYAGLGYGDIVMSEQWRMLGPLEAANGILMFGLSTAVMTAAVMDVIKYGKERILRGQGE